MHKTTHTQIFNHFRLQLLGLTLLGLLFTSVTWANDLEPKSETHKQDKFSEKHKQTFLHSSFDKSHLFISQRLENLMRGMDTFFAADNAYQTATESYLQATSNALVEKGGQISFSEKFRIKADLPKTKNRLKFKIETDPEELQAAENIVTDSSLNDSVKNKKYYTSLQTELDINHWSIRPSLGVKASSSLDPFAKVRFTKLIPLQLWLFRFDENIYWFDSTGFGYDTIFEFDRHIGKGIFFRSHSFVNWNAENDYFGIRQIFSIFSSIRKQTKLSYQIGAFGNDSQGRQAQRYEMLFRLRDNSHQEWLFIEIRPQIEYKKENRWHADFSLFLSVDMVFGHKYL